MSALAAAGTVNAASVSDDVGCVGNCSLSSVYLEDARQGMPVVKYSVSPPHPQKEPSKSAAPKPKRKRAKDYAREALQAEAAAEPSNWIELWDPSYQCPYYVNIATKESSWEKPESGFLEDPSKPKAPSKIMESALASVRDKRAFRAAKRDAEHLVGLLLRVVELPEPEVVIGKLEKLVTRMQLSLQGKKEKRATEKYQNLLRDLWSICQGEEGSETGADNRSKKNDGLVADQKWDTLEARSTGLMKEIPPASGSHLRFTDDGEELDTPIPAPAAQSSTPWWQVDVDSDNTMDAPPRQDSTVSAHQLPPEPEHRDGDAQVLDDVDSVSVPIMPSEASALPQSARSEPDHGQHGETITPQEDAEQQGAAKDLQAIVRDVVEHTVDKRLTTDAGVGPGADVLALKAAAHVVSLGDPSPRKAPLSRGCADLSSAPSERGFTDTSLNQAPDQRNEAQINNPLVLNTYLMLKEAHIQKYWHRRHSLWSKFDEGIMMDLEGWFSATPEAIAKHQAERLSCDIALDGFGGVGGNAVQLAMTCKQVLVCDNNMERLLLARHNAEIYGVAHKLDFVCCDALKMAPSFKVDAIFLSPPWGGPRYHPMEGHSYNVDKDIGGLGIGYSELLDIFGLALHSPTPGQRQVLRIEGGSNSQTAASEEPSRDAITGKEPVQSALHLSDGQVKPVSVACFLPKTSDLLQISQAVEGSQVEVERTYLNRLLKSITVYHGFPPA